MPASGETRPPVIPREASAARSSNSVAAQNARCNSCSDCIACLQNGLRFRGFVEEYLQRRNVGVPFDERRLGAEALDRLAVQLPHRRRDARAMGINETCAARFETCEMDFVYALARNRREIRSRIETVVDRVDVDIVDVEQ